MADDKVRLVHSKTKATYTCAPDAVPAWEARGWKVADSKPAPTKSKKED